MHEGDSSAVFGVEVGRVGWAEGFVVEAVADVEDSDVAGAGSHGDRYLVVVAWSGVVYYVGKLQ